jgi:branched-chain amino acid transport system permease protein
MILGGTGMLFGPIVGAFAMALLEDWLAGITEHGPLVIGVFVILTVVLLPNGIAGLMVRAGSSAPVGVREDG